MNIVENFTRLNQFESKQNLASTFPTLIPVLLCSSMFGLLQSTAGKTDIIDSSRLKAICRYFQHITFLTCLCRF